MYNKIGITIDTKFILFYNHTLFGSIVHTPSEAPAIEVLQLIAGIINMTGHTTCTVLSTQSSR